MTVVGTLICIKDSVFIDPATGNGELLSGETNYYMTTDRITKDTVYSIMVTDRYGNTVTADCNFHYKEKGKVQIYSQDLILPYGGGSKQVRAELGDNSRFTWESKDTNIMRIYAVTGDVNQFATVIAGNVGKTQLYAYEAGNTSNYDLINVRTVFKDAEDPSAYYFDPVYWAVDGKITVGAGGAGLFSPNAVCTREQIVTFLWRAWGSPKAKTHQSFTDVKSTDWYYEPISWAYENNITTGLNDGTGRFGVGQACTREMAVTFLYRNARMWFYANPAKYKMFTDVTDDKYYFNAISWAYDRGITTGLNDGTGRFGVGQKCSRAMIVSFLYRFFTNMDMNDYYIG